MKTELGVSKPEEGAKEEPVYDGKTAADYGYNPLKSLTIADRHYDLLVRRCTECGEEHYEIWRWCSLSFARYHLPRDDGPEVFADFVEFIDEQLLIEAPDLLQPL